jgi:hypothetical protein
MKPIVEPLRLVVIRPTMDRVQRCAPTEGRPVFVIRLNNGEEVNGAENDELTVNEQTGVLTVHRIDGFEQVTTHYSPSAWAWVTHRKKEHVVRRSAG